MKMKHKFRAAIVILLVMIIPLALHHVSPGSVRIYADGFNATMECAGNTIAITATAPSAITAGTALNVTRITSTATVPAGITVNKIVSTMNVANASPAVVTGTWTGNGVNTVTAPFPDVSVSAGTAVGSQITLTLASIALYINGGSTPITCDVPSGLLTAAKPGESFIILSANITAPPVVAPTSTSAPVAPKTSTVTPTAPTAASPTTPAPPNTTVAPVVAPTAVPSKKLTMAVTDSSGHPVSNATVSMDGGTPVQTDGSGNATFDNVTPGKHVITVKSKKGTVVRSINLDASLASYKLAVQMPKQAVSNDQVIIAAVGLFVVVVLVLWGLIDWRKAHTYNIKTNSSYQYSTQATAEPTVVAIGSTLAQAPPVLEGQIIAPTTTSVVPSPAATVNAVASTPVTPTPAPVRAFDAAAPLVTQPTVVISPVPVQPQLITPQVPLQPNPQIVQPIAPTTPTLLPPVVPVPVPPSQGIVPVSPQVILPTTPPASPPTSSS